MPRRQNGHDEYGRDRDDDDPRSRRADDLPPEIEERRQRIRRDDDLAQHEIVERAIDTAPIVAKLIRTWRVSAAVAGLCTLLGGLTGALGYRIVGPQEDIRLLSKRLDSANIANRALISAQDDRTDSLFLVIRDLRYEFAQFRYIQCIQIRRDEPDLAPDGCDASTSRPPKRP